MALYLAPISNGLGDLIVSIPILQSLIDHPLQSDFIWGSKAFELHYSGYKINDVLKGI